MITIENAYNEFSEVFVSMHDGIHMFVVVHGLVGGGQFKVVRTTGVESLVPMTLQTAGQSSFVLYMEPGWTLHYKGTNIELLGCHLNDEIWPS